MALLGAEQLGVDLLLADAAALGGRRPHPRRVRLGQRKLGRIQLVEDERAIRLLLVRCVFHRRFAAIALERVRRLLAVRLRNLEDVRGLRAGTDQ